MARRGLLAILLVGGAAIAGCQKGPPPLAPPKPPEVLVGRAVLRNVTDYEEFTGRTQAVETVEIRARVSGYLNAIHFKEGGEVHKGDLLFEIDPRPFKAELDRAEANLQQAQAHLQRLDADYRRGQELLQKGSIGREEFDRISGDRLEARGAVGSASAARDTARLNLEFSRVKAPASGRISRRWVDPGNMVKADETSLTLIVSQDPIYALFDVDERTYRRIQRYLEQRRDSPSQQRQAPFALGLADEEGFPHQGWINFVDNRVDPDSVSVWVRGTFPNKDRRLAPGLFARLRLPIGKPKEAIIIPERALGTDQGQKFVYVVETVDGQDKAIYRRVELGEQHGPYRVVTKGVQQGERVILSGLQRVKFGSPATPQDKEDPPPPEDLDKLDDKPAGAEGSTGS